LVGPLLSEFAVAGTPSVTIALVVGGDSHVAPQQSDLPSRSRQVFEFHMRAEVYLDG